MSLPTVEMTGNAVEDPELRFTPNGAAVARLRVACTERVQDRETKEWKDGDSCFLTVEVWRQMAENVAESVKRGTAVTVKGRLRQRQFETREGEKRTVYEVKGDDVSVSLARQIAVVSKAGGGNGGGHGGGNAAAAQSNDWAPSTAPAGGFGNGGAPSDPPF